MTLAAAEQVCTSAIPSLNDSRQPEVVAAIVVMMVLAVTSVVLRLISRMLSAARFGADDALILVALVKPSCLQEWPLLIHGRYSLLA